MQILAIVVSLAVTLVAVALFGKTIGHIVSVIKLGQPAGRTDEPGKRTVTLAKGETVVVSVRATSAGPTCRWVLEADYVDHGKRKTMTIKAPGDKPFAITGWADGHPYESTWNTDATAR